MEETITNLVEKELNCKVLDISVIGKGASATVYKVKISTFPNYDCN